MLVLAGCFSCRKPAGTNWDVDLALPLVNSRLNVTNFVADSIIRADSSGLLHLAYKREIASLLIDSLVKVPDTTITIPLEAPVAIQFTLYPGDSYPSQPEEVEFKIGSGVEISFVDVRTGFLHAKFSNSLTQPLDLLYRIPSATKNGKVFEAQEQIPPGETSLERTYDLSGYRLSMRGEKGNEYNTIVHTYTVSLSASAQSVVVPAGHAGDVDISFSEILPQYIEGFFGRESYELASDTVDFEFLDNIKAGNFLLSEANMTFRITNGFGADFLGSLSGVTSVNSASGKTVALNSQKLSRITLDQPPVKYTWGTQPSTATLVFDHNNSNITQFISNLPDRISYQGKVSINPPPIDEVIGHSNYAFYGHGIRIHADIDIPVKFTADRFVLQTTADIDLSTTQELDNVRGGNFVISVTNGFPFAAQLEVYMLDEKGVVIDSLFLPGANVVQPGVLGANSEVVMPYSSELLIAATPEKAENLKRARSLRIMSTLLMPPPPVEVRIYEDYELEVKIRAELKYNVGIR